MQPRQPMDPSQCTPGKCPGLVEYHPVVVCRCGLTDTAPGAGGVSQAMSAQAERRPTRPGGHGMRPPRSPGHSLRTQGKYLGPAEHRLVAASTHARPRKAPGVVFRYSGTAQAERRRAQPGEHGTSPRRLPDLGERMPGRYRRLAEQHSGAASTRDLPHNAPGADGPPRARPALAASRPAQPGEHGTPLRRLATGQTWQA